MSCIRCGGLNVFDHFYGVVRCSAYRCVNCGAITNIQILLPERNPRSSGSGGSLKPRPRPGRSVIMNAGGVLANEVER